MKFPQLVRNRDCKIDISVKLYEQDVNEDGAPVEAEEKNLKCNFQETGEKRYDEEHNLVKLYGKALFNGDVFPEVSTITGGEVLIFGEKRKILKGSKERNPDGTVNYTKLELM